MAEKYGICCALYLGDWPIAEFSAKMICCSAFILDQNTDFMINTSSYLNKTANWNLKIGEIKQPTYNCHNKTVTGVV